jgi:hypothetical protein
MMVYEQNPVAIRMEHDGSTGDMPWSELVARKRVV